MSVDGEDERRSAEGEPASLEGSSRALSGSGQDRLTLGAFLRVEREKRGVTPEQLASATKINVRRIHALEGDLYSELPAAPFVRGFIESYCRFIGLNPREVLLRFDSFLKEQYSGRGEGGGVSGYAFDRRELDQGRTLLWVALGVFMVFGMIGILVLRPSTGRHQGGNIEALQSESGAEQGAAVPPAGEGSPTAGAALSEAGPTPEPSGSPLPSPSPSSSPPVLAALPAPSPSPSVSVLPSPAPSSAPLASASPAVPADWVPGSTSPDPEDPLSSGRMLNRDQIRHKIIVRALADVWVRYRCDSRAPMKFILRAGKVLVLRGSDQILLQASNTDAVEISYNQSAYRSLGKARAPQPQTSGPTWVFGASGSNSGDVFPGQKPLVKTPGPVPSPSPSPSASISQ